MKANPHKKTINVGDNLIKIAIKKFQEHGYILDTATTVGNQR